MNFSQFVLAFTIDQLYALRTEVDARINLLVPTNQVRNAPKAAPKPAPKYARPAAAAESGQTEHKKRRILPRVFSLDDAWCCWFRKLDDEITFGYKYDVDKNNVGKYMKIKITPEATTVEGVNDEIITIPKEWVKTRDIGLENDLLRRIFAKIHRVVETASQ